MAGAIGRPVGRHGCRRPGPPVAGHVLPAAVLVQVIRADNFGAHVPVRPRVGPAAVPLADPLIPGVGPRERHDVVAGRVEAFDIDRFARLDGDLAAARRHGRAAATHGDARITPVIHVHAVAAGAVKGHGGVGSVDLEDLVLGEAPDLDRSDAGPQRELLRVVGQVERGEVGAPSQAHGVSALHLELDPAAAAGVDPVAERHRNVAVRRLPVVGIITA